MVVDEGTRDYHIYIYTEDVRRRSWKKVIRKELNGNPDFISRSAVCLGEGGGGREGRLKQTGNGGDAGREVVETQFRRAQI